MSTGMTFDAETREYSIGEVSKATGLSHSVLRIWERRYQWPRPRRHGNRYRIYSADLLNDLQWAVNQLAAGWSMRDLVMEGELNRNAPAQRKGTAPCSLIDFAGLPQPKTVEGWRLRQRLEEAL